MEVNLSEDDIVLNSNPSDVPMRRHYFKNEIVEWELTQYLWTGCTSVILRDKIMGNASELIRQVIRKQGLHQIYPGQDESSFGDLLSTGWMQIEKTLYKYRARPHCRKCFHLDRPNDSIIYDPGVKEYGIKTLYQVYKEFKRCKKCHSRLNYEPIIEPVQGLFGGSDTILFRGMSKVFNMWSQISRTVILAYIKKEGRDRKNSQSYMNHLNNKSKPLNDVLLRFIQEARQVCIYNKEYLCIIDALEYLVLHDFKPYDGLIGKLMERSKLNRATIAGFLRFIKLNSLDFTDSPINRTIKDFKVDRRGDTKDAEDES